MKRVAVLAAALAYAQAHALSPADALSASTTKLFLSGSPSVSGVLQAVMGANCTANSLTVYVDAATKGARHRVFTCTVNSTGAWAKQFGLGGKNVAIFKQEFGGSLAGVSPVATGTAIPFLSLANCDADGACSTEANVVPLLGYSDVEPAVFKQAAMLPVGVSAPTDAQLAKLTISPVLQQSFAVAVNDTLYAALQQKLGTSGVPHLSHVQLASLVGRNGLATTSATWGLLASQGDRRKGTQINVCRGKRGSGIQAVANIAFAGGCKASPEAPLEKSDADATAPGVSDQYKLYVDEAESMESVASCLNSVEGAGGYGVGYVSLLNPPRASDHWKVVGLSGAAPSPAAAAAGEYDYVYESTFQYATASYKAASADLKQLVSGLISEAGSPTIMAAAPANTRAALVPLVASHVSRGGDSCATLKINRDGEL